MRVMVAGGAGFLGSHLARSLLSQGHDVVCVDDLSTGSDDNIADIRQHERFEFIKTDVAHAPAVKVDAIAHLASPASPVDYDRMPIHTLRANSLGMYRMIDIAGKVGARLLFTSTSEVYGDPLVHPQPETYWGNVDPVGPRSCYDEAKRFGEALLFAARREYGLQANVVRLFNTYGPAMRRNDGRVIPEMLSAALTGRPLVIHGDGTQTRSFCYVSDLIDGYINILLDDEIDGEIFNIGNPEEVTVRALAEQIVGLTGSSSEIRYTDARPGDPERRRPLIDKISARYGWQPTVPLRDGLIRTVASFRTAEAKARALAPRGKRSVPVPVATEMVKAS